jgi:hypothetical protein
MENNSYGEEWASGDVISVMLDLDNGSMSYQRNGVYLGVAFSEVDVALPWFPAVSLAAGQACEFYFGGTLDPLRYVGMEIRFES